MTATTKPSQTTTYDPTLPETTADPATTDATPEVDADTTTTLSPRQQAFALSQAESAIAADTVGDANGDDHFDGTFAAAPPVPGQFQVPLSALGEWVYHPRFGSRQQGEHFAALALTAAEPDDLDAIVVLPAVDGVHPIFDGRFTYFALKKAHAGNEDVTVRCVLYPGSEAQAVQAVCDTAVGTIEASAMERAQAVYNLQRVNGISQRAIMDRYPRLKKDKVSNMLIAARMREAYPVFFNLLIAPDQAPISYGTDILALKKAVSAEAFHAILDRAEDIAGNGERFRPHEVFDALQVERVSSAEGAADRPVKVKPIVPIEEEEILGHDDQPVAAYERLADNIDRIRLPDVSGMSLAEREAAADACIAQVRRHFGLDAPG